MRLKNAKQVTDEVLKAYAEDEQVLRNTAQAILLTLSDDLKGSDAIARLHAENFINKSDRSDMGLSKCCKILNISESFVKSKILGLSRR